jgi:uncharacterized protein DUF2530
VTNQRSPRGRRIRQSADMLRDPDPLGGRPHIDQIELGQKTYLTARVQPLDLTGVRTVTVGAILWLLAFFALLPFYSTLQEHDRGWWLWTSIAGFGLGLLGLEYCRRRRDRLAAQAAVDPETSPVRPARH